MAFGKKKQKIDPIAAAEAQRAREVQEVDAAFKKGITALRDFIARLNSRKPISSSARATLGPTTCMVILDHCLPVG